MINGGEKVKLGFFDPDPYPGDCDFVGCDGQPDGSHKEEVRRDVLLLH